MTKLKQKAVKSRKRAAQRKPGAQSEDAILEKVSQMKDWNEFVPAFQAILDKPEFNIPRNHAAYRKTVLTSLSWWILIFGRLPVHPRKELDRLIEMLQNMRRTIPTKTDLKFMAIEVLRNKGESWDDIARQLLSHYSTDNYQRWRRDKLMNDYHTWKGRKTKKSQPKPHPQKSDLL
jgi:hypothetical protein